MPNDDEARADDPFWIECGPRGVVEASRRGSTSEQKSPRRNAWDTGILKPSQGWHGGPHGLNLSSHGDLSQGRLAMRLTVCRNRWLRAALLAAWVIASGCQRLPYIDQSKPVPHDNLGRVALEDKEVKQADLLSSSLPMQLPKVAKPRTTNDPEAQEIWPMTLAAGDPDRPGQLRDRPRDRLRCPGHPDRRLRADAPQHRGQRGRRQLAGCRHAAVGLRSGDPRDPDRHGPLDLRHRLHDQPPLGQQRAAVQQRRAGRLAQLDRHQVSRSSR